MHRKRKRDISAKPDAFNRYAPLAVCTFLLVAVVLAFGQTVGFGFVNYDDDAYVYENPYVQQGLTSDAFSWAMSSSQASNWHPVTWLSHMLDCQLYDLHAGGHHATSVLLHAITAILLFLVLRSMTGDLWPSAFVAAIFAVHPLRVESVAWVAERKDVLSGLFFMLTLGAYLAYVRRPFSLARYLTVVLLFVLGLMAKPMLVTLPFVLLLLDYWPLGRITFPLPSKDRFSILRRLIIEKVPLLLLSVFSCVITSLVQTEAIVQLDKLPLTLRIENALVSYVTYLGQFFCPMNLAVLYPHPGTDLPTWKVAASLLLLLAISWGVLAWRRKLPYLLVGWLWYLGMLVPVIGLVQVGSHAHADRYTYLPQIGLCIALAWGGAYVARSWPDRRLVFGATSAMAVAVLIGCAWHQTTFWRDSQTLWTRALACTSGNYLAHVSLGNDLRTHGLIGDAVTQYEAALKIHPDCAQAYCNLGAALTLLGKPDQAVQCLQRALKIVPSYVDARVNLGEALSKLGRIEDAVEQYQQALKVDADCVEAHYNLGVARARQGRLDDAMAQYEEALRIDPNCTEAHANLGASLEQQGRIGEAMAHYQKAFALAMQQNKPSLAEAVKARMQQISDRSHGL